MGIMDDKTQNHYILSKHSSPAQSLSNTKNFFRGSKFFVSKYGFMVFKTTELNPRKRQKNLKRMHDGWEKSKTRPFWLFGCISWFVMRFFHFSQAICHYFEFRSPCRLRGLSPVVLNTINPYLDKKKIRPSEEISGIWEALSRRGVFQKYIVL